MIFFFNDTATTEIYTLSLHDALPIWLHRLRSDRVGALGVAGQADGRDAESKHDGGDERDQEGGAHGVSRRLLTRRAAACQDRRSEEHTSELQSRQYLVCRLLLEKKKK